MEYLTGKIMMVQSLVEIPLVKSGFLKLIHDGSSEGALRFYREYEIHLDGKTTGSTVRFVYNKREDWAEVEMKGFAIYNLKLVEKIAGGDNGKRIQVDETIGNKKICSQNEGIRSGNNS